MRSEYRAARNMVSALTRSAKRQFYRDTFFNTRNNAAKIWSLINEIHAAPSSGRLGSLRRHFGLDVASLVNDFNH